MICSEVDVRVGGGVGGGQGGDAWQEGENAAAVKDGVRVLRRKGARTTSEVGFDFFSPQICFQIQILSKEFKDLLPKNPLHYVPHCGAIYWKQFK